MRFLIITIITLMAVMAAEETVKLPSSTESAIKKHEQAIEKARAAYLKAFESIKEDTAKVMVKEIEKATKSGDLKLALAVQEKAEEIAKSLAMVKEEKSNEIKKSFEDIKDLIVGKWSYDGTDKRWFNFNKDGTFTDVWNNVGTFEFKNNVIKWTSGPNTFTLKLIDDKLIGDQSHHGGTLLKVELLKVR